MMNSFIRKAPPYLVPLLFIVVVIGLFLLRGTVSNEFAANSDLHPADIVSSTLTGAPSDRNYLVLTLKLTPSGINAVRSLVRSHPGESGANLVYQGTTLGKVVFSDNPDPGTLKLTLPMRDAITARLTINK